MRNIEDTGAKEENCPPAENGAAGMADNKPLPETKDSAVKEGCDAPETQQENASKEKAHRETPSDPENAQASPSGLVAGRARGEHESMGGGSEKIEAEKDAEMVAGKSGSAPSGTGGRKRNRAVSSSENSEDAAKLKAAAGKIRIHATQGGSAGGADEKETGDREEDDSATGAKGARRRKNYSTAYFGYRVRIHTSDVIKYFQKKTFSVINNCLFNLCMVLPIHMDDREYDSLYRSLCRIFENTETQLEGALERMRELTNRSRDDAPQIRYTAPMDAELQLKTPLALRYVKILESLDLLLIAIDQALTAGYIENPRDAVKLKYQWTRQIFMFTGQIRDLDRGRGIRQSGDEKKD